MCVNDLFGHPYGVLMANLRGDSQRYKSRIGCLCGARVGVSASALWCESAFFESLAGTACYGALLDTNGETIC